MMTDPISDMLTRIRNAGRSQHAVMRCPNSQLKQAVANVLSSEGFIGEVHVDGEEGKKELVVNLRYSEDGSMMIDEIHRVSTPGCRVYVGAEDVPRVRNGLGMSILTTSKGVMCDRDAREAGIGGEVMCEVW
jgi:small subunit ribosomal protein S8